MDLTLDIDEDLLLAPQNLALKRGTTVNHLVRSYLADLADAVRKGHANAWLKATMARGLVTPGNRNCTREDLHER